MSQIRQVVLAVDPPDAAGWILECVPKVAFLTVLFLSIYIRAISYGPCHMS
jgi:hypothetical protein